MYRESAYTYHPMTSTSKPKIPKGWRVLRVGERLRPTDKFRIFGQGQWVLNGPDHSLINKVYTWMTPHIRRIAKRKPAKKTGGKRK